MALSNIEMVLEGYRAFRRGNMTRAFAILGSEVEWQAEDAVQTCGSRKEVEARLTQRFTDGFPFELTEAIAAGDHVMLGFRDAQETPDARYFAVVEIEDGTVRRICQFGDRKAAVDRLNALTLGKQ